MSSDEPLPHLTEEARQQRDRHLESIAWGKRDGGPLSEVLPIVQDEYDAYAREVRAANPQRAVQCSAGCAGCCQQWVHDVHAVEIEAIVQVLKAEDRIAQVLPVLREAVDLHDAALTAANDPSDAIAEAAIAYWRLARGCPLLDEDQRCSVYHHRPMTCRSFFSLSDPQLCTPDGASAGKAATFFIHPHDDAFESTEAWGRRALGSAAEVGDFFPALLAALSVASTDAAEDVD